MKKKEKRMKKVDIREVLLDDNNIEPIIMFNDEGKEIRFDQIAVIPLRENDLYCILKPITKVNGIGDDEAVVFKVEDEENGGSFLKVEEDEITACRVFNQYYNLIESDLEDEQRELILSVIRTDTDLQDVCDEETGKRINYENMDIHPCCFQGQWFAIIKDTPETSFTEALVWKVIEEKHLVWIENELLQTAIIQSYLERRQYKDDIFPEFDLTSIVAPKPKAEDKKMADDKNDCQLNVDAMYKALEKRKAELLSLMIDEDDDTSANSDEIDDAVSCINTLSENELDLVEAAIGGGYISQSWIKKYFYFGDLEPASTIEHLEKLGIIQRVSTNNYKFLFPYDVFVKARKKLS